MTHRTLTMRHGQSGRLRVAVKAPDGADTTLAGAVCVADDHRPMLVSGSDLIIAAMPPGDWLYEVRCGGVTIMYGLIEVQPSPLGAAVPGEVGWQVDADVTADIAIVTVTIAEGLPGAPGRDGRDGQDGRDGATPEIGANGNWHIDGEDTGQPSVAVIDHATHTVTQTPAAGLADNYELQGWQMTAAHTGTISAIAISARDNRDIISPGPRWLKLWIVDSGVRYWVATSSEARVQAVGQTAVWPITADVVEGQVLVVTAHDTPDGTAYSGLSNLSCRAVVNTAGDGGIVTGSDGLGLVTGWLPSYTVRMQAVAGVSVHGVQLITRAEMESYVADYVAAHAPAVNLADYQGPINLRAANGNPVLTADADGNVQLTTVMRIDGSSERVVIDRGYELHVTSVHGINGELDLVGNNAARITLGYDGDCVAVWGRAVEVALAGKGTVLGILSDSVVVQGAPLKLVDSQYPDGPLAVRSGIVVSEP